MSANFVNFIINLHICIMLSFAFMNFFVSLSLLQIFVHPCCICEFCLHLGCIHKLVPAVYASGIFFASSMHLILLVVYAISCKCLVCSFLARKYRLEKEGDTPELVLSVRIFSNWFSLWHLDLGIFLRNKKGVWQFASPVFCVRAYIKNIPR